jgi:phage terminase Nu1 subunit (DNA packaging protein)
VAEDAQAVSEAPVIGLPVREQERYVTRVELAQIMGVSVRTIDSLVRDGMPSETWGIRSRRFRPSAAIAWARSRRGEAA